ncbi:DUF1798 family protein [Peribacillus frigoritolerans]|nr:DUF1798 family protein [Peribacillus frigoritolerans]
MQKEKLQLLTEQLIKYTDQADDIYEGVRLEGKEKDFFFGSKAVCRSGQDRMHRMGNRNEGVDERNRIRHLFPEQIEQTAHNLSDVAVQAFFSLKQVISDLKAMSSRSNSSLIM